MLDTLPMRVAYPRATSTSMDKPLRKQRKPVFALLFSLLTPGLGHVYAGQLGRGVAVYFAYQVFVAGALLLGAPSFLKLTLAMTAALGAYLFVMFDAYRTAAANREHWRRFNRWYVYILLLCLSSAIMSGTSAWMRSYWATFKIPGSSMAPTLVSGDHIMVDKTSGYTPTRNDVVVIRRQDDPSTAVDESEVNVITRIVGLPGEEVEVRGAKVLINGQPLDEDFTQWTLGGMKYFDRALVPSGMYFMLGDNRDASLDSRYWPETFITREKIVGKVVYIYWNLSAHDRIGKSIRCKVVQKATPGIPDGA